MTNRDELLSLRSDNDAKSVSAHALLFEELLVREALAGRLRLPLGPIPAKALVHAGLHPATGGDGVAACSGDMLLQALVACAGVTLRAVATALGVPVHGGTVTAEGDLDFRGTLGVNREALVGFADIRLHFDLETDATPEQLEQVLKLTERYCVIYQTLRSAPPVSVTLEKTVEQ